MFYIVPHKQGNAQSLKGLRIINKIYSAATLPANKNTWYNLRKSQIQWFTDYIWQQKIFKVY